MFSLMSVTMNQNKVASAILALVVLALLALIAVSILSQAAGFDVAGIPLVRYCVGSGSVCTGDI